MLLLRRATAVGRPGVAASPLLRRAAPLPACRRPAVGAGLQQLRGLATDAGDKVVSAADKDEYDDAVAGAGDNLIVSYFTAAWCGPCKAISPIYADLSNKHADKVTFIKVDVDENEEVAMEFGIRMMPTFVFSKGGETLGEMAGADPDKLTATVEHYA